MISKSKINWKVQIALFVMGGMVVMYLMLRPTYEIKVFKLGFYPYTPVTQMIYSDFFERELIYIYGEHLTENYPKKDYLVMNNFAGFNSYDEVVADRDSANNVIIYSISGDYAYKNPTNSRKIYVRQVDNGTFIDLCEKQIGLVIKAY